MKYTEHHRPTSLMDVTVRTVCTDCNNGWMSALEVLANPILRRLIAGAATVTADEADIVRLWAAKTAAVIQMAEARASDSPPIAAADRASLRRGDAPDEWVVTLTRLDPSWRDHTHRGYAPVPLRRVVDDIESIEQYHFTTIEIGCMLLTVTGGPPESDATRHVCRTAVTHLWNVVPALQPLVPGEPLELRTWQLPSTDILRQLTLYFARLLHQEDQEPVAPSSS
ncbi:hypothetical protein MUG78_06150 [Gordonia alkaliphila]|uniref:hypothetical protein n=1 Tax=Gordonia alkaliphila TaxID=1053547 RepID=UPI001FF4F77E|nr:hypothetical protein [Gordonia alkaliphila]MCK0439056.1 hypothetical protein [Gordonia alkaliphila]